MIVEALRIAYVAGAPFLVTELMQRGSLRGILRSSGHLPYAQKIAFVRDAARGMAHLHSLGRIHRDLKTGMAALLHDF